MSSQSSLQALTGQIMRRLFTILACGGVLFAATGCNLTACSTGDCDAAAVATAGAPAAPAVVPTGVVGVGPATTSTVQDPADVKYYRSDEPLRMGIEPFNRG